MIRNQILKNAAKANVKGTKDPKKKIYINMDYTKKEREENKELRDQLRSMSEEERKKVMIKNGRIVKREVPAGDRGGGNGVTTK